MVLTRSQAKKIHNDSIKGAIKTALDFLEKQSKKNNEIQIDINTIRKKRKLSSTYTNILYDSKTYNKTVDIKEYDTLKNKFNELTYIFEKLKDDYEDIEEDYKKHKKNAKKFKKKMLKRLESDSFTWKNRKYVRV